MRGREEGAGSRVEGEGSWTYDDICLISPLDFLDLVSLSFYFGLSLTDFYFSFYLSLTLSLDFDFSDFFGDVLITLDW